MRRRINNSKSSLTEIQNRLMYGELLAEVLLSIGTSMKRNMPVRKQSIDSEDLTLMVSLARILVKGDKEGAEEASAKARVLGWKEELAQEK